MDRAGLKDMILGQMQKRKGMTAAPVNLGGQGEVAVPTMPKAKRPAPKNMNPQRDQMLISLLQGLR